MKFLVDTQLPPKLATYLSDRGYQSIHTTFFEDGHLLKDQEIIVIAKKEDRTIITKDSDFSEYFHLKGAPPRILLIEFGNMKNTELFDLFDQFFEEVISAFEEGSKLVLFRRDEVVGY